MKKLLTLALMLAIVFTLASCAMLPEDVQATINGTIEDIKESMGLGDTHTHDFTIPVSTKKATCLEDGAKVTKCACGEEHTEVLPALGHNVKLIESVPVTCEEDGSDYYACSRCKGESYTREHKALGHDYSTSIEPSRFAFCQREGCDGSVTALGENGKYREGLTFNFTEEHEAEIDAKYNEVLALIEAAPEYDPALHGYATEGALADEYASVDALHTELYDLVLYAVAQRQIIEIEYYCDMKNTEIEDKYSYMMDYYTDLIAKFYSLSQPFYDSCYRDFYYYGMSEEEIKAYLFDANALADPDYAALKSRNDEIELIFFDIGNPRTSSEVPVLYAEFVDNNNKMAQIMGYDNYLEYAYENVYGRDYSYQDVATITDYVEKYMGKIFGLYYGKYQGNASETLKGDDLRDYEALVEDSFFTSYHANHYLNNYIDCMSFTTNPDKQISFSDELNNLCIDGNLYRGQYNGAFVTYLESPDIPVAYFGPGYDGPFTVVHEFGHFMNEIYNKSEYSQSYDLLEMHSQGNEMLFLAFLEGQVTDKAFKHIRNDQIFNMLATVMSSVSIDTFERAVYTNSYDGTGADEIMADGAITHDEYDQLYKNIQKDLGIDGIMSSQYWRLGMTFRSPCYYISYAVSAISVLQIYEKAQSTGFDAAAESYLKLFTYTDVNPEYTDSEVLEYAGMYAVTDEELYITLSEFFNNH